METMKRCGFGGGMGPKRDATRHRFSIYCILIGCKCDLSLFLRFWRRWQQLRVIVGARICAIISWRVLLARHASRGDENGDAQDHRNAARQLPEELSHRQVNVVDLLFTKSAAGERRPCGTNGNMHKELEVQRMMRAETQKRRAWAVLLQNKIVWEVNTAKVTLERPSGGGDRTRTTLPHWALVLSTNALGNHR